MVPDNFYRSTVDRLPLKCINPSLKRGHQDHLIYIEFYVLFESPKVASFDVIQMRYAYFYRTILIWQILWISGGTPIRQNDQNHLQHPDVETVYTPSHHLTNQNLRIWKK